VHHASFVRLSLKKPPHFDISVAWHDRALADDPNTEEVERLAWTIHEAQWFRECWRSCFITPVTVASR
jgi:hypothetical protein